MITEVGKPFPIKLSGVEGMRLEYDEAGPLLLISFRNPSAQEIEGAKTGKLEMAFYESSPIIFLVAKIAGMGGWMDAPFSIRIYDGKRSFDWSEEITEGHGLSLQIILIDINTNIIKAQRLIGASTQFSRGLRAAILRQLEQPFDHGSYQQKIDEVYKNFSSDDIAMRAECHFKIR